MRQNITIDNVSPLISYTPPGAWAPSSHSDKFWTEYSEGTYTATGTLGAAATFTFNGTGVWLFGAFRDDHGQYNVTIDGRNSTFDGHSDTNLFQQALFSAPNLEPGTHVVTIVNNRKDSKNTNLDLDHIIWESSVGGDTDNVTLTTEQDTAASFEYGPVSTAWSTAVENVGDYSESSGHSTVGTTAFVTYTFTGSAVSIFGALGPNQGPYQVSLDGAPAMNYTGLNAEFHAQQILYRADGLENSQHKVVLTNAPSKSGELLSIDYAVFSNIQVPITTSISSSSTTSSTSTNTDPTSIGTPPPTTEEKKGPSTGVVVGTVLGILAFLGLLAFFLIYSSKRKKRKENKEEPDMLVVPEPFPPLGVASGNGRYIPPSHAMHGDYLELGSSHGHGPTYPPSRPRTDSYGLRNDIYNGAPNPSTHSLFSGVAPAMAPGPGHYPPSPTVEGSVYRRDSAYTAMSDGISRVAHDQSTQYSPDRRNFNQPLPPLPDGSADTHMQPQTSVGLIPPRKTAGVTLPPTASEEQRRQFEGLSEEELRRRRLNIHGRAQDFGPVIMNPDDDQLPPDYTQATEVLRR